MATLQSGVREISDRMGSIFGTKGYIQVQNKWKVLILRDLMPGSKRFGKLQRSIGQISQKVLTSNLKEMETKGIVHRKVYAEVPPRVEYSLTDLGKSLKPILDSMWNWGENYKRTIQ